MSVSQLTQHNLYDISFSGTSCLLRCPQNTAVLAHACMKDHLYSLMLGSHRSTMLTSKSQQSHSSDSLIWHACLGHVGQDKLSDLPKQHLYRHSLPCLSNLPFCEPCKIKKHPYAKKSAYRAQHLLELVHTDLCGPISKPSFAGSLYFMPFVDDHSRMTFTYYLRYKHQAFDKFKQFLFMSERQTGQKLHQLRSDGAGELTSSQFQDFCYAHGILYQVTIPHSSEMNGVAENKHQNLQYQARSMLLQAKLPTAYWPKL